MNNYFYIGTLADFPRQGARIVQHPDGEIAVFRTHDDLLFALRDRCPHKGGPLSQGIVHGTRVTCPLHNWRIDLQSGNAVEPDVGCAAKYEVRLNKNEVWLARFREHPINSDEAQVNGDDTQAVCA